MTEKTEFHQYTEKMQDRNDHLYSPGWFTDARNWIIPKGDRWPVKAMKMFGALILLSWLVIFVTVIIETLMGKA